MNLRTLLQLVVIAVSLGTVGSAVAVDMQAPPEPKTQNGVAYLSGGVGVDQANAMKAAAKDYSLMLTCATKQTGQYLSQVKVSITDKSGSPVLETVTEGPILLAQLAPGQYRISAESNGVTVNETVQIGSERPQQVNLYWPAEVVQ